MAKAEAGSPMPPHARIPSYMTAFQSSPVRIWWQENTARLCHDQAKCKVGASLCLYGPSLGGRLREVKNKGKSQTFSSKSGRDRLQEVPNIVIWLGTFWWFGKLVAEERWSQTGVQQYPVTCTFCDAPKCLQFSRLLAVCFSLEFSVGIMRRDFLAQRRMARDMGAAHFFSSRLLPHSAIPPCLAFFSAWPAPFAFAITKRSS